MFDNVAIDVFIGLISIYLLYSLLASIIMEILAKYLGLRARITLRAISKLLEDSDYSKSNSAYRLYLTVDRGRYLNSFKRRELTALFYAHPNIKNLGQNDLYRKPATISAELFADTFIQLLRGDRFDKQSNTIDLIKNNLRLDHSNPQLSGTLPVPSWYQVSTYKPFTSTNNTVKICDLTLYQLKQFLYDSHSDIDLFRSKLIGWYNEMMDRATGWYTKQTRKILFFIGLFLALGFNIDSIYISEKLANNKAARDKMVELGVRLQNNPQYNPDLSKNAEETLAKSFKAVDKELNEANTIVGRAPFESYKPKNFVGWFLTAFAISLGAPFWFDLLGKIMNIRQGGNNTSDKNKGTTAQTEPPIG